MVLTGLGVFWGVLGDADPTSRNHPSRHHPPQSTPQPPTKKARHSPPQKVCTENLTKSPKYDNIQAVLAKINRTEHEAQASRKKTKKERKLQ